LKPKNDYEALVLALSLALTAPTDELAAECAGRAERFAAGLTAEQVADAQVEAAAAAALTQGS